MSRFIGDVLSGEFEVSSAPDGEAGLAAALARLPDANLTDVMMPRMTGEEFVRAVRRNPELDGVPVLVLTARADDALRAKLLRLGAQDFLMKPFVTEEVRARIANLVSVKRAREVLQRELTTQTHDVVALAGEVAARKRELEMALEVTSLAKEEAERASTVKTHFLRLVSHELRTPLTTLNLQLQRLSRDAEHPLPEHQRQILRRGSLAATRLTGLVEVLLHQAQIASGRLAVEVEGVDLDALVRKVVEQHRPQAEDKGLALRLRARGHVPWVETNRASSASSSRASSKRGHSPQRAPWRSRSRAAATSSTWRSSTRGRGLRERIRRASSGPSSAARVPAEQFVPGLGVGLAVVRDLAAAISARVELSSSSGMGHVHGGAAAPPARAARGCSRGAEGAPRERIGQRGRRRRRSRVRPCGVGRHARDESCVEHLLGMAPPRVAASVARLRPRRRERRLHVALSRRAGRRRRPRRRGAAQARSCFRRPPLRRGVRRRAPGWRRAIADRRDLL
jgi:DNA-binding response OmpR family regulator